MRSSYCAGDPVLPRSGDNGSGAHAHLDKGHAALWSLANACSIRTVIMQHDAPTRNCNVIPSNSDRSSRPREGTG